MPREVPNMNKLLEEYFYSKNVEIIKPDETKFNSNTLVEIKCKDNPKHTYKASVTQIRSGLKDVNKCPHCLKEQKYNNESRIPFSVVEAFIKKNNLNVIPKKDYYSKWDDKVTFNCATCGDEVFTLLNLRYFDKQKEESHICLGCLSRQKVHKATNIIKMPVTFDEKLLPFSVRYRYINQNKWHIFEYTESKKNMKVQCLDCGHIKNVLPFNLFNEHKDNHHILCPGCGERLPKDD